MSEQNSQHKRPQTTGRTYAGLTPEQRQSQRREQFLNAGLKLFGTTGFRSATVRSLCKAAKLTDRYFYQSFGSLEKLLMAIYERCMIDLKRTILRAIIIEYSKNDAEQAIIAGLDAYFEVLENPHIARICMVELEGISVEVNELYYAHIEDFSDMLISLANNAFPSWSLEQRQRQVLGISLVGAMRQAATHWLINQYKTERKYLVSATSQLFLGLLSQIKNQDTNE